MEIDIASAIDEMLDRRETVCIEGIGSLLLENLSAKFSKDGKNMTPPSAYLTFFDTQTKNKPLRKYLSKKYKISKDDAEKAISKFSQSVVKALDKHKQVNIEGILKFEKKAGKVRMKPLKGYQERYYAGLPVVPAKKLKKNASKENKKSKAAPPKFKVKAPVPSPKFDLPKVKKESLSAAASIAATSGSSVINKEKKPSKVAEKIGKPKSSIADPVVIPKVKKVTSQEALAYKAEKTPAVLSINKPETNSMIAPKEAIPFKTEKIPAKTEKVSAVSAINKPEATNKTAPTAATPLTPKKVVTEVNPAKESNLNEKLRAQAASISPKSAIAPEKSSSAITAKSYKEPIKPISLTPKSNYTSVPPAKEGLGCMAPFLGLLGILLLCFLLWKGCHCIMDNKAGTKTSATEVMEGDNSDKIASTSDSSVNGEIAKDGSEIVADTDQCIIITGVFSDYRNVKRMEEKLMSHGHDVYSEEYGPHTRVGFRFDCSDEDLPEHLHKIRAKFSKKAWYLVPELYVEYR